MQKNETKIRLQKYLADCGVASRRKSEEFIVNGDVKVNGEVITELGYKVNKDDVVTFKGKVVEKKEHIYFILNKPTGVLSSSIDEKGKKCVVDLIDTDERIYPIGRLNYNVSGAIILTNDGQLANKLNKKSQSIKKIYQVRIDKQINQSTFNKLFKGFTSNGKKYDNLEVEVLDIDKKNDSTLLKLSINDTKNNDIDNIFEALGYKIKKMKRIEYAGISIEGLGIGEYRVLKLHEIRQLYSL